MELTPQAQEWIDHILSFQAHPLLYLFLALILISTLLSAFNLGDIHHSPRRTRPPSKR